MKILELRFKNLNSLYGEWIVDFTDPEYVSNGIFALTGPTGAGKSTILDGICLALYGATPRLKKITKSGNEIMSRQTGECYAEVLFESQAGRFRCHWEQRRARKKTDGNLQDQEHQIADAATGKPIETKRSLVAAVIEEKTGMDFDRFTRSILLAQGEFDKFFKADIEQKSKILEQITGTGIYTEISRRVHERLGTERESLKLLQAEISGILLLEPEQEKQLQSELDKKFNEETGLLSKKNEVDKAVIWLTTIENLKRELNALTEEEALLQGEMDAFEPEREKLDRALKASSLDGIYATLSELRKQQADDREGLKKLEGDLPELANSAGASAESVKAAEQQTAKAKEELQTAAPLMKEIRSLDQKLVEQKKTLQEGEEGCGKIRERIETDRRARRKELEKRSSVQKEFEIAVSYLREHAQDEWLVGGLTGVEEQIGRLYAGQVEMLQNEKKLSKSKDALALIVKKIDENTKQNGVFKKRLEAAVLQLQHGKDALVELLSGRLLREYRSEKETLLREIGFLKKIEELEEQRKKLKDGKPCPLCGAKEHPFAEGNIPVQDETERKIASLTTLITNAEDIETANNKLQEAETVARNNLIESEKQATTIAGERLTMENIIKELKETQKKLQTVFREMEQNVSEKLAPLGIFHIKHYDAGSLLESLRGRLKAWQTFTENKTEIEEKNSAITTELKRLDAIIETNNTTLTEKREQLEILKREHTSICEKRNTLYGNKNPDDDETLLNKAVADAEEKEKLANDRNNVVQHQLTAAHTTIHSLKNRIERNVTELSKKENVFIAALEPTGFADEKQFVASRLPLEHRDVLTTKAKRLDQRQTELEARRKDRQARLAEEAAAKVTDKPLNELESLLEECEESLKQIREIIAAHQHKLNENKIAGERIQEKQVTIDAQRKECSRWENLHSLIGSADGKKYRNFAQGLTFELMVAHANRQLEKMTDRYLLVRDEKEPLELNVVDSYQAGEIRSAKNLSGGESFIVSLSLALGLSKMASRKVRVDSLFLDEGFGTLDDDSLETALETLAGLQQDGKLIGVISHVPALKERISTQITITPVSGGRSELNGPGVQSRVKKNTTAIPL